MIKSGLNSIPRPKYASSPFVADPNSIILMHFDGTNGSTTFTDVYSIYTPTASGSAAISTTQSVFGGASLGLPGATSFISATPSSTKLNFGTGDFTYEYRVFLTSNPAGGTFAGIVGSQSTGGSGVGSAVSTGVNGTGNWFFYDGSALHISTVISTGTYHAVALVRSSGTFNLYVDGVSGLSVAIANAFNMNGIPLFCGTMSGGVGGSGGTFAGFVDELRISNIARYTSNYTPATSPFAN